MTPSRKFTDASLRALKLPEGKREARLLVERGLYLHLRLRQDGTTAKQWQYRVQLGGARRWLSLGGFPAVGLAKVREELLKHEAVRDAAKKGEADHPVITERQARKGRLAMPTVAEVFEEWIADKRLGSPRKQGLPVRERTIVILRQNYSIDIEGRIGVSKIATVTPQALRGCIDAARARKAPGAAAMVYRTLRGLTRFALKRGYIAGADPMMGIENPRPYRAAEPNAANDAEVLALLQALDASRVWPSTRYAVEFQLLTGARPGEVRLATWSEINFNMKTWTLPSERVKTDRSFKVFLAPRALEILELARALPRGSGDFVFPGQGGAALEKMAVARALKRLAPRVTEKGGKALRPHDLRKTFRTMLSRLGIPPHVAELCLNHLETETMRRVYDGHDYSGEMADAWSRVASHLVALRNGGAQVVSLQDGRARLARAMRA